MSAAAAGLRVIAPILSLAISIGAAELPLRVDAPASDALGPIPVAGGVPFPLGVLDSVEHLRLAREDGGEVPCQATRLAVWPDGSVKWALIDTVLPAGQAKGLRLAYGAGVGRTAPPDALSATVENGVVTVFSPHLVAMVRQDGGGFVDEFTMDGRAVLSGHPRLRVDAIRLPGPDALVPGEFLCQAPGASVQHGQVKVDSVALEATGPIRATVLLRGRILLPELGATLPDEVKAREAPGSLPFSMRLSFFAGTPTVVVDHQLVFTGEPDRDALTCWAIDLPGMAGPQGALCVDPGVVLAEKSGHVEVARDQSRLCWAPLAQGLALVRHGWENRPTAVVARDGVAAIELWPAEAGALDLRRYAREWSVGETGDTKNPAELERYARYAARGMAKSHEVVLDFAPGDAASRARALSERALLVAPPEWYAASGALGPFAAESDRSAALDAMARRRLDYHLFSQDLFRWHGQLVYGFWQYRYGQAHRIDRWDCDYGRWGWSLDDGAGRIGQALMQEFLRTLDRRYFDAGEAFSRIAYDTNLVHTQQHLEPGHGWWTAIGCSHRHNVQPFGCPYVGMRGSYPGAQRLLYALTGDGVIGDGLDLVAGSALAYAEGAGSRLCCSGGTDGEGSAANALLWKYEVTGERKYLEGCRKILDQTGLIPTDDLGKLGYGPGFGVFNAAGEYAQLSGDQDFRQRVIAMARKAAGAKEAQQLVYAIAIGAILANDEALRAKVAELLQQIEKGAHDGLEDQPPSTWPGHGGWKTPALDANLLRDLPTALAAAQPQAQGMAWPKAAAAMAPAAPPSGWYRPGGAVRAEDRVPSAATLLALRPGTGGGDLAAGAAKIHVGDRFIEAIDVAGAKPLAAPITAYIDYATPGGGDVAATRIDRVASDRWTGGTSGDALVCTATSGSTVFAVRASTVSIEGVPALHLEIACKPGGGAVASWGLRIPSAIGNDAHARLVTAPGRFRLERCRLDQNDERLPNWLTSEYHWGEGAPLWPLWRLSGIELGPGDGYRCWRANRVDTVPVVCDQGEGGAPWLDLTDRGASPRWGLTARVLRSVAADRAAVRVDLEHGVIEVQCRSAAMPPLASATAGLSAVIDLIPHDGWRPPLSKPELTAAQYEKFIDDLGYGENYGLCALRFALSTTHQVSGRQWMERIRDLGIEPREILYGFLWADGLENHCRKLGVAWDANDVEGSVRRVIDHYRR
jgi:hypothetical protein